MSLPITAHTKQLTKAKLLLSTGIFPSNLFSTSIGRAAVKFSWYRISKTYEW